MESSSSFIIEVVESGIEETVQETQQARCQRMTNKPSSFSQMCTYTQLIICFITYPTGDRPRDSRMALMRDTTPAKPGDEADVPVARKVLRSKYNSIGTKTMAWN